MITEPWRILRIRGLPCLLCLLCDSLSMHLEDVQQFYCPQCGIFLLDLPENFRRPSRNVRNIPGWRATPMPANEPESTPEDPC
jgi:predicted RNA-binding Zn-ribbon protein involved in translation (DUF1610 family)